MKSNEDVLSSMLKTTQMGQIGIRCVLDTDMSAKLRSALESQLREYDSIETEAHKLASSHGWEVRELDPGIRAMSEMMTRMRFQGKNKESKIAGMMIQGNSRGIIKGGKNLHHMEKPDGQVTALSRKLLETESNNIRQMQDFL